jgi:hypothetical protein
MSNPQGNLVWVQLRVGETNIGDPFEVDGSGNVSNLKDAVKAKFPNALKHVDAPELKVYAPSGSSSSSDPDALRASTSIADCVIANTSDNNPFIVQAHRGALVTEALPPAQQPLQPLAENGELLARASHIVVLCYVLLRF